MDSYLATPKLNPRGGILVIHAWWGLNDFFINFCDRLSAEGFIALAPDLYHGAVATTVPEAEILRGKTKRAIVKKDILLAVEQLQSQPVIKDRSIGVIGFSMGAYWSLWLAEEQPEILAATVLFYGTRTVEYSKTSSAFLGHFAETDKYVSASGKKKLEKALQATGNKVVFYTYPDTDHWFFENNLNAYQPDAASLAWQRTTDFLHTYL
ncbi:MAG TPA: dienelactone hydrolase family protein [Anaerolineales bacterium]